MLRFVTGLAGSGKTTLLIEKMKAFAENGDRLIYLVPEQYSFEAEREMHRRLGGRAALHVEVLSFTRLCNSVFRAYGGLSGISLGKTAKYLLMSQAASEVKDKLTLYRKSCSNTAFLETLIGVCGEFKAAGVGDAALADFAEKCGDGALRQKLGDLALIYSAYQSLIERGYSDPDDDLIRACALLENNEFFAEAVVFIDGFTTFMAAEFELLGHVIAQSREVYCAFTADGVTDTQRGMGVFSAAKAAMRKLSRLAENSGTGVAEPEILSGSPRYLKPELSHIARFFMQPAAESYTGEYSGALMVSSAADIYGELGMVAAEIARLVREEGLRYNEIAVVARDVAPYSRAIETAFSMHRIPYFLSVPEDIENKPLVSCVLAALGAVRGGFDPTLVLLFAKSPLLGLPCDDVALLENYCYCWSVRGALWREDFANNPRGLVSELTEADVLRLSRINAVRRAVIEPLLRLREHLRQNNGRSFATGIFELLRDINAAENLKEYAFALKSPETFLDESAQLWDALMDVLDVFGTVLSAHKMTAARICELFKLAVGATEVSSVPRMLDEVLIGAADRIRPAGVRAVFVIGANENIFPAQLSTGGVFSDAERGALINAGLEIAAPVLQKSVLEKYFAYFALTLPSERLFVSYARSDLQGRERLASEIVTRLEELFPSLPPRKQDALSEISGERSAFEALSRRLKRDDGLTAALREIFSQSGYSLTLERMERAAKRPAHAIADKDVAGGLFGKFMRLSPSRVERFYKCPFSYFISDGLGVKPRGRVEFTGLESGSVIHHVLQAMVQKHGGKGLLGLTEKEMSGEILAIIRDYLAGRVEDIEKMPSRLRFLFDRLAGMLSRLLRRLGEEFAQSEFEPAEFELPIKLGGRVEPLRLETPDGAAVVVEGVVDRLDVMNKGGKRYIRVVDYKSGIKKFEMTDVLYGLNMQMLLYLFTIAENGSGDLKDSIPSGVLYMPAREKYISAERDADGESINKAREKEWRMNGLLLDDEEALRGMERDIAGVFIPAKLNKSGTLDASSSIVSYSELGRLAKKVKRQIGNMASLLGKGAIEACPTEENGGLACEYCDYRAVCGFEPGDPVRQVGKLRKDELFKILAEEEPDGEAGMD